MRFVGLDVHARETVGVVLDPETGELTKQRVAGRPEWVVQWLETISRPFRAVYEAGPTGYGLYRRAGERRRHRHRHGNHRSCVGTPLSAKCTQTFLMSL